MTRWTEIYCRELTADYDGDSWTDIGIRRVMPEIKERTLREGMVFQPYDSKLESYEYGLGSIIAGGITYRLHTKDNPGMGADYLCVCRLGEKTKTDEIVTELVDSVIRGFISDIED